MECSSTFACVLTELGQVLDDKTADIKNLAYDVSNKLKSRPLAVRPHRSMRLPRARTGTGADGRSRRGQSQRAVAHQGDADLHDYPAVSRSDERVQSGVRAPSRPLQTSDQARTGDQ